MAILSLNGNDLVSDKLENAVHNRLEALQDFLVGESHVSFFNASFWELSLDTYINSPLLVVVAEIGLDSVFKVHDTLCVDTAGCL
jgi:hypothetical protein